MKLIGFDVETAPVGGNPQEYALQPWRVLEGRARVTSASMARADGAARVSADLLEVRDWLMEVEDDEVLVGWNTKFDIAWAMAHGLLPSRTLRWLDGALLWKWLEPNRDRYSLANATKEFLSDLPWTPKYLALKEAERAAGFQTASTQLYNALDSYATVLIAERLLEALRSRYGRVPAQVFLEAEILVPTARSWLEGVPYDPEVLEDLRPKLQAAAAEAASKVGLDTKVLNSPVQLRTTLYDTWGWPVQYTTEKGEPSTDKTALTYATDHDDRAATILEYREARTRLSKFIESAEKAREYLGSWTLHPEPYIYSTYTGRFTYGSKQLKKHPTGIALHQMPRPKDVRRLVRAPKGFKLVEYDFSGQEMRGMAEMSGDRNLIDGFQAGKDMHSMTGAAIGGLPYERFMERLAEDDPIVAGPKGLRYLGKLTNLSLQYRTSAKTLRRKARVDYGVDAEMKDAKRWYDVYHRLYPGVADYWDRAIALVKQKGYAETPAGRRYYIPRWRFDDKEQRWAAESSALNFPIQGLGADQKELGLAIILKSYDFLRLAFDLHDGLFMWVPECITNDELRAVQRTLSALPFKQAWGWEPRVKFPVDMKVGPSWGELKEVK